MNNKSIIPDKNTTGCIVKVIKYKDERNGKIAFTDNHNRLCFISQEDLSKYNGEKTLLVYVVKSMKSYDFVRTHLDSTPLQEWINNIIHFNITNIRTIIHSIPIINFLNSISNHNDLCYKKYLDKNDNEITIDRIAKIEHSLYRIGIHTETDEWLVDTMLVLSFLYARYRYIK